MTRARSSVVGWVVGVAALLGAGGAAEAQSRPGAQPARPAAQSSDDWENKTAIGLEIGSGGTITSYVLNDGPSSTLFYVAPRVSLELVPHWAGQLTLRQWFLPGTHATMLGVGPRFEPHVLSFGRVFVDLALGPVTTSQAWTFGLDVGGGFEWDLPDVPGFSLGPYVRYGYVMNPDRRTDRDGHAWSLGASFSYHFGRAASAPKAGPGARRPTGRYQITIPDTDRDGIGDDRDECKTVPVGKHPDPFKTGCPENDEDGDDVPDSDDACPVAAPGPTPDPNRRGCPLIDTDKDGVPDYEDACILKPGPASSDRAHSGCPDKKAARGPAVEEENPPPAEPANAPKTTRKRQMK